MNRRDTVLALSTLSAAWPLVSRAQSPKVARIGALVVGSPDPEPFWRIFREALRERGYIEGKNILLEFRTARGNRKLLNELAADLVRLKVDVIVTWQTPTALAAKQATLDIPIVMADSGDPVGTGLIVSLARPGGNITGIAGVTAELAGKSVELVREILPSAKQIAALCNSADPFAKPFLEHIQLGGRTAGVLIKSIMISSDQEFEAAFPVMVKERMDAVIVQPSLPTRRAAELALKHRLPAVSVPRWFAEEGGLMTYSARLADLYRNAAVYVDKILKGAKPSELPVEQPTRFELVINLKTAKALGLKVPQSLLARADEVIH